jgi:hypothetical protein
MTHTTDRSSNRSTASFTTQTEWLMKPNRSMILFSVVVAALALFLGVAAFAQDAEKPPEGVNSGSYNVRQTAEFGYRFTNFTGSQAVYNTFVNLRPGARLLDYKLDMRSLNHQGIFFDNLSFSNFGYGGDPNNVSRLRIYKNKIYNFNANFRRDYTYWDYNLLANPLNPVSVSFLNAPAGFTNQIPNSPHQMGLVRRTSDYNLTLFPQSRLRFRLGYVRNIQEGPAFTTTHEGTDPRLLQNTKSTMNGYQFGVDFKFIPRTSISYDQFLQYYRGDTATVLAPSPFTLANGTPVNLGLPLNPTLGQPCTQPFNNGTTGPVGTVYAGCGVYLGYSRTPRPRTTIPVEQLSIQSNYFKRMDLSARVSYTSTDMQDNTFNEILRAGFSRTLQVGATSNGTGKSRRVSTTADLGVTFHITEKLRVTDTFRFYNYQIPGNWAFVNTSQFPIGPLLPNLPGGAPPLNRPDLTKPIAVFNSTNCPSPFTALTCPQHGTSSPADIATGIAMRFLGQNSKYNTFEVDYDVTRRLGARMGFRYGHRVSSDLHGSPVTYSGTGLGEIYFPGAATNGAAIAFRGDCAKTGTPPVAPPDCTLQPDGSVIFTGSIGATDRDSDTRTEYSGLIGLWARPVDQLRLTLDMELLSADNTFTRIAPRNLQHYKGRFNWKPEEWLSVGGAFNIYENRNNVTDIFHREHNRSWSLDIAAEPSTRYGFDAGIDYNDVFSSTDICYALTSNPSPTVICPSPNPIQGISLYQTRGLFGYGSVHFRPVKRLYMFFGAYMSRVTGSTTFLAPTAPPGPLRYHYYRPYAGFDFEIYRGLSWKADWNFDDYNETFTVDVTTPARNFRGNRVTIGARYTF